MTILGIDTATHTGGIAIVADDGRVIGAARTSPAARAADLLVTVDQVFREAEIAARSLAAVAVGVGPGSFTGLRIGMATAKGIAFAVGCPLWGVSSLHALAWDALHETPSFDGLIVAALDARRGEIYAGCFRAHGDELVAVGGERVLAPAAFVAWIAALRAEHGAIVTCAGDARGTHASALTELDVTWLDTVTTPSGIAVAALASAGARVDVLAHGVPSYIRPAEAEVMYPDGVPGALRRH